MLTVLEGFPYCLLLVYVVEVLIIPNDNSLARAETCRINLLDTSAYDKLTLFDRMKKASLNHLIFKHA